MRALKIAALSSAMILPVSATAFAADAIIEQPPQPAPVVEAAPVQVWTGPYAGLWLGHNWADFESIPGDNTDLSGGAYGGYNWQFNNIVVGVEADAGYSGVEENGGGLTGETGFVGSARARAGVAFDPFLIYATGGVAAADIEYTSATGSDSNTQIGYTVGGGVEGFITENVTGRIEYRYTDYGSDDYNVGVGGAAVSGGYDEHSVRAGIGIKF